MLKIAELPKSPGYEVALTEHGFHPVLARALAHLVAGSGRRRAKEQQLRRGVVHAIKKLKVARTSEKLTTHAKYLLQIAEESSIVDTLCCEAGLRESDLLQPLQAVVSGKTVDRRRITEMVERLECVLHVPRGRKTSAASLAHEFLLESDIPRSLRLSEYTLSDKDNDFTDPLSIAARLEFGDNDFDPRPAHRRVKKRRPAQRTSRK